MIWFVDVYQAVVELNSFGLFHIYFFEMDTFCPLGWLVGWLAVDKHDDDDEDDDEEKRLLATVWTVSLFAESLVDRVCLIRFSKSCGRSKHTVRKFLNVKVLLVVEPIPSKVD